jgi:hypothetical protein
MYCVCRCCCWVLQEAQKAVKAFNKLAKKLVGFEYLWHMAWVESVRRVGSTRGSVCAMCYAQCLHRSSRLLGVPATGHSCRVVV